MINIFIIQNVNCIDNSDENHCVAPLFTYIVGQLLDQRLNLCLKILDPLERTKELFKHGKFVFNRLMPEKVSFTFIIIKHDIIVTLIIFIVE